MTDNDVNFEHFKAMNGFSHKSGKTANHVQHDNEESKENGAPKLNQTAAQTNRMRDQNQASFGKGARKEDQ